MKQVGGGNTFLTATLHGVRLALRSGRDDFHTFTRAYLAPLVDDAVAPEEVDDSPIQVQVAWPTRPPQNVLNGAADRMEQLGRRLWAGPGRLRFTEIWQFPGLALDVVWQDASPDSATGAKLTICAAYMWPSRRMRWLASLLPAARERLFVGLIYYLVYFPWMWWLERERGWTLLHAGAVNTSSGSGTFGPWDGVVFSGLPGCGKSTTTLAFLNWPEWQIVSDNLLFTDGRQAFACVEPIHVDERTRALVGNGDDLHARIHATGRRFSHGRQDYEVTAAARSLSTNPRALGFLHVGHEMAVRRLDADAGARRLLANDHLAKEWAAYQESAAAIHQLWPAVGDLERRRANLWTLAHAVPCYDVTVTRGEMVRHAVSTILLKIERDI